MTSLMSLLRNEHAKLFKQKRTWVMFLSIIVIVLFSTFVAFKFLQRTAGSPEEISPWGFVSLLGNVSLLVGLFAISIASNILTMEFAMGTIKFLMIRPITRGKVMLSKYLTVLSMIALFYLLLFGFSLLAGGVVFGFHTLPTDNVNEIIRSYLYGLIEVIIFATFAFMISVLSRSNSLAMGLSIPLYLMGGLSNAFIQQYDWSKYSLFVNLNLDMYDLGVPYQPGMTLGFSLGVLVIYYILFLAISFLVFKKRDIV